MGKLSINRGKNNPLLYEESEKEFQEKVIRSAHLLGWKHYHTHDSRRSPEGFPDLLLVKVPKLIFAELKSEKGKPTPAQTGWLTLLKLCHQEVFLWRPSDWDDILMTLKG
jgi:hypothetical protein